MLYNARLAQDVARDLFDEGIYVVGSASPWWPRAGPHSHAALGRPRDAPPRSGIEAFVKVGRKYDVLGRSRKDILERYGP